MAFYYKQSCFKRISVQYKYKFAAIGDYLQNQQGFEIENWNKSAPKNI